MRVNGYRRRHLSQRERVVQSGQNFFAGRQYRKAIWIDYDHDYDLDLMLLGEHSVLMRNNGDGTFLDVTQSFPFASGTPVDAVQFQFTRKRPRATCSSRTQVRVRSFIGTC